MSPFIHGLMAGFFIGVGTCGAFVLYRLQRRPKMPTLRRRKYACPGAEIVTHGSGDWLAPYKREPDLADVGGIGDQPIYMYGVTGEER
jgi:hypothetical protein